MSSFPSKTKKASFKSPLIIAGILAGVGLALLAYLMFYVEPANTMEVVKVVAVTDDGCIAETLDGYAVNIGACKANPGDYVDALVDQKLKERAALMNPTT